MSKALKSIWFHILWVIGSTVFITMGFVWGEWVVVAAWTLALLSVIVSIYFEFIPRSQQIYVSLDSLSKEDTDRVIEVLKHHPNALVTIRKATKSTNTEL